MGVHYPIIGVSQRNTLARLLGGGVVRSLAQQLPDSIQLLICGTRFRFRPHESRESHR
jgi:hypothetical protein